MKKPKENLEVRVKWYGGLAISPFQLKMIRENIQMEQHYKDQKEKHELLIHAIKLGLK